MMDEMAPMMAVEEQEKPMEEVDEDGISIAREHELTPCCCCLCACSNEYTTGSSCCGCFPIKCGVIAIGAFTVLLTIYMVTMNFFLILNEYIHWYFPVVIIVLLAQCVLDPASSSYSSPRIPPLAEVNFSLLACSESFQPL